MFKSVKKEVSILIFILIFIFLLPPFFAATKTYNYNVDQVYLLIYPCLDFSNQFCNSVDSTSWFNQNSGSNKIITIGETPSDMNIEYHFRDGYLPKETAGTTSSWYTSSGSPSFTLQKQLNCKSSVSNIQVSGKIEIQSPLTITANLANVFTSLTKPSNFIPSGYDNYYTATTTLKFYVNNIEQTSKTEEIPLSGKIVTFTYTPNQEKNYIFKIESTVTDNQCSSYNNPQSDFTSITINPSTPTCTQGDGCKTGCSNGDLDCTCSQQSGDLCTQAETCTGTSLSHSATGTCCSVTCTTQQSPSCNNECTKDQKQCSGTIRQTCKQNANGCYYWQNTDCSFNNQVCSNGMCVDPSATCIENWTCTSWSSCTNNQQTRTCTDSKNCGTSATKPSLTQSCTSNVQQTCQEDWTCGLYSECDDGKQTRECIDTNGCNTITSKPSTTIFCNETIIKKILTPTKEQPDINDQFKKEMNNTVNEMLSRISDGIQELIASNKYYFLVSFVIIILIISLAALYFGAHKEKILKPRTKIIKSDKKSVKINDLMLSVIDSLDADEREVCYAIIENEGLTQEDLQKKSSLSKTKLEIALTKLERRQVIKKREDDNSKLYINDWLK